MKKITLLISEKDKELFISDLRKAGVVHIKSVKEPVSHDIQFVQDKIDKVDQMIATLELYKTDDVADATERDDRHMLDVEQEVRENSAEKEQLITEARELKTQKKWYEAWGAFDPADLNSLRENGIDLKLYRADRNILKKIPEDMEYKILRRDRANIYLAVLGDQDVTSLPMEEAQTQERAPGEVNSLLETKEKRIESIEDSFRRKAGCLEEMRHCLSRLEKGMEFLNVKYGMQQEEKFAYMQGFCPEKKVNKIKDLAGEKGAGYFVEDPADEDEPPTLITNPAWIRIIDPVFQFMNTIPGYKEFDISMVFLIFFSLFFAMLVGDAGYGSIFLVVTFLVRMKFKKAPREPFSLMYILSVATIIWGMLSGTWFGSETINQLPGVRHFVIDGLDSFGKGSQAFVIYLCFVIGAVHLTLARMIRCIRYINHLKAIAEAGWMLIIWGMFFAAGKLVLGRPFPVVAGGLLLGGILLVLVFANSQKNMFKGMAQTMTQLPLSVIGSFSDVVSYLRLFAVGYATVVLASTFNEMALGGGGPKGILGTLCAALILFVGHGLNILLSMMAVVVHGIRLNMLEFSGHLGMQWAGDKYNPFKE
ncbi:MAG: hypothetical protein P9L88_06295 [Candidatus Tantalella remota]|nr:hypothetical protein [Candidatus Tantalella remota]